jgi:hypothetical protein
VSNGPSKSSIWRLFQKEQVRDLKKAIKAENELRMEPQLISAHERGVQLAVQMMDKGRLGKHVRALSDLPAPFRELAPQLLQSIDKSNDGKGGSQGVLEGSVSSNRQADSANNIVQSKSMLSVGSVGEDQTKGKSVKAHLKQTDTGVTQQAVTKHSQHKLTETKKEGLADKQSQLPGVPKCSSKRRVLGSESKGEVWNNLGSFNWDSVFCKNNKRESVLPEREVVGRLARTDKLTSQGKALLGGQGRLPGTLGQLNLFSKSNQKGSRLPELSEESGSSNRLMVGLDRAGGLGNQLGRGGDTQPNVVFKRGNSVQQKRHNSTKKEGLRSDQLEVVSGRLFESNPHNKLTSQANSRKASLLESSDCVEMPTPDPSKKSRLVLQCLSRKPSQNELRESKDKEKQEGNARRLLFQSSSSKTFQTNIKEGGEGGRIEQGQKRQSELSKEEGGQLVPDLHNRFFLTPTKVSHDHPEVSERTQPYCWLKLTEDGSGNAESFVDGSRRLRLAASKLAHLDGIRKVEWVRNEAGLFLCTFSEDGVAKTWRVEAREDQGQSGNQRCTSAVKSDTPGLPHPQTDPQNTMTQKHSDVQASLHHQQCVFPVFANSSNRLNQRQKFVGLKKESNSHQHVAPIFSSCVETTDNGLVRVFSGDSKGVIHGFVFNNSRLTHTNTIKAGSEPVWAMAQLNQGLLVTSSPNKVRVFKSESNSERTREEFVYQNNSSFYGQLRTVSSNSLVVNCFSRDTLKSDFCVLDLFKAKESARIHSDRLFSNSFVCSLHDGMLYSANEDRTVSLYDLRCRQQVDHFYAHSGAVVSIDVSAQKGTFVTAGADSSIRIWDLRKLRICDEVKAHMSKDEDSIFEVKFDPSGNFVASCGADGVFKIFQV